MACLFPYRVTLDNSFKQKEMFTDCGRCLNCLVAKESALTFLAQKELLEVYKSGRGASFVTLTYDDSHIPITKDGLVTLRKRDLQLWIKNMRRQMDYYNEKIPFKYLACGELGSEKSRPHYHICILGLTDVQVSKYTKKLWKNGLCDIGALSAGGLRYVCKYLTKARPSKEIKKFRENLCIENPFIIHSIGLGKDWINRNLQKIVDDEFTFNFNKKINLYPKYILRYVSNHTGVDYIPFVRKYLLNENRKFLEINDGKSLYDHQIDNSYIQYKQKVASLRSKGKAVTDETLSKKWIKPYHFYDRQPSKDIDLFVKKILKWRALTPRYEYIYPVSENDWIWVRYEATITGENELVQRKDLYKVLKSDVVPF